MNPDIREEFIISGNESSNKKKHFEHLLWQETRQLQDFEEQNLFSHEEEWDIGVELEAWFLDKSLNPKPFTSAMLHELKLGELSAGTTKDRFEMHIKPLVLNKGFLEEFEKNLTMLFQTCNGWAEKNAANIITIGMLPHISPTHFSKELLADCQQVPLLNARLLQQRGHQPWSIKIQGDDEIELINHSVCLKSLPASTVFHLRVPYRDLVNTYNRTQALAAPMIALSANAPFFNNHSLWNDTRIPLLQQTLSEQMPPACFSNMEDRVLFGGKYVEHSIMEIFQNNLQFSSLLPLMNPQKSYQFHHLKLHNDTIWRWNRPILESNTSGNWSIRLEHRVQSAGTSPADIAAQLGFFTGILAFWQNHRFQPESTMAFNQIRYNFYQAAKYGLEANIFWGGSKPVKIVDVIGKYLFPQAKKGLLSLGLSANEIDFYLNEVLGERVKRRLSGALWQKNKAAEFGSVQRMLEQYQNYQQTLKPLWKWRLEI